MYLRNCQTPNEHIVLCLCPVQAPITQTVRLASAQTRLAQPPTSTAVQVGFYPILNESTTFLTFKVGLNGFGK